MFKIKVSKEIPKEAKVLAVISMRNKNFTIEKFNALINFLKPYNTTLLIADSLQRHNLDGNIKAAKKLGTSLLNKCNTALKNAIIIHDKASWNQYKDEGVLKIIHWDTWKAIKEHELHNSFDFIESLEKEDLQFNQSLQLVAEGAQQQYVQMPQGISSAREKIKENSINCQKEELAYMLTFSEFDIHLYPEINQSQRFLCDHFHEKFKMPENISFEAEASISFEIEGNFGMNFFDKNKKEDSNSRSISFPGRQVLLMVETYFNAPEFSVKEKELVMEKIAESYKKVSLESINQLTF